MGFVLNTCGMNQVLSLLSEKYLIFAPVRVADGGRFSDTDVVRYGEVRTVEEIVFDEKPAYSFKEVLFPVSQTLFYFTEHQVTEPEAEKKEAIVFLRSCDLASVKRLDQIYLHNGNPDYYYEQIRHSIHFSLMGCGEAFDSCFCVDMGANLSGNYDLGINAGNGIFEIDCKWPELEETFLRRSLETRDVTPKHVTETKTHVHIPENLSNEISKSSMWREYDGRCINCGRCNFVCPTCTCFTMQDIYYTDNGKNGERRRVWASCMVDGYTDVAGGGSYRKQNGDRMRFKTLHKVLDFKQRNGFSMCVGCGRCDDICPEYISFSHIINRLEDGMKEVSGHAC